MGAMPFTRTVKRYMSGEDVYAVKLRLAKLGYLSSATHDRYGNDTHAAVKAFQIANGLVADGIVGRFTWAALFPRGTVDQITPPIGVVSVPSHISAAARSAIGIALAQVSPVRGLICIEALNWAHDPSVTDLTYPQSFYIRGGNLYDGGGNLNIMTMPRLNAYLVNPNFAPYYADGAKEMMLKAAALSGYKIPGADCSGGIVGLWRKSGVQSTGFDSNADTLYGSHCTDTKAPIAGDLAWRSGHIGLVVGGGYVVEWIGGAYGCQLTKISDRQAYSFLDRKLHKLSAWSAFGDPKKY